MRGELLLLASFVNHWLQALDSQILYAVLYGIARTDSEKTEQRRYSSIQVIYHARDQPWHFLFPLRTQYINPINYIFYQRKEDVK